MKRQVAVTACVQQCVPINGDWRSDKLPARRGIQLSCIRNYLRPVDEILIFHYVQTVSKLQDLAENHGSHKHLDARCRGAK
jgi:hypothetical protein